MPTNGDRRPGAGVRRAYLALTASYYVSMAVLFVGLPILAVAGIRSAENPAIAFWASAMLVLLLLSARARARGDAPGRLLTREEAPRLFALVESARTAAGIGPVGEVRIAAMPNVGVTRVFRGGILYTRPVKVLVLGLPAFRSQTVPELEAILVHEFGHFLGRDVDRGERLEVIAARLRGFRAVFDRMGTLRWFNPVYLWVRLYGWFFARGTARLRRWQETRADALAAEVCGPTVYARALLKSAATRALFRRLASRRVAAALARAELPRNLFLEFREAVRALHPDDRRRTLREVREAPEPSLSAHPALADRLESLGRLWVPRRRRPEERAANLVPGIEEIEVELTPPVTRLLAAALVVRARRRAAARDEAEAAAPVPEEAPTALALQPV